MYKRSKYYSQSFKKPKVKGEMKSNSDNYKCEICGEMFNNRYNSLIHNASHIIIPLSRIRYQKCQFCINICTSVDMKTHLYEEHGFRLDLACKVVLIRLEDELRSTDITHLNDIFESIEESLDDGIERPDSFNDEVRIKTEVDEVSIVEKPEVLNPDYVEVDGILLKGQTKVQTNSKPLFKYEDEDDVKKKLINNNQENDIPQNNYRNKIIFENDVIVSINQKSLFGLVDNNNDDGVDDENKKWLPNGYQPNISFEDNNLVNDESLNNALSFSAPIDYETLIQSGEFACKRCSKMFPNRLLLIQHETSHMKWKRPQPAFCMHCDRYIARGPRSLHKHVTHCHPDVLHNNRQTSKRCTVCGLKYVDYTRHKLHYHGTIDIDDDIEVDNTNESRVTAIMKTLDVCELCYSFFKMRRNCRYVIMGECEVKGRRPCGVCGKEYFVLKSVKKVTMTHNRGGKHKKGPLSNEARLKMIHRRLKNMR